jgi:hypothetical protein
VGSRERKRAERRKRKRRSSERLPGEPAASAADAAADGNGHSPEDLARRAEAKNQAAREALEPLSENERPAVVTIGAIISGVLCASILIGWVAGVEVEGERPHVLQAVLPALLMGVMAWGMWRARYWAVLGFQTVLVFLMIAFTLQLVAAGSWFQVVGNLVLLAGAGTMFVFMVKALARIQMPDRRPPSGSR